MRLLLFLLLPALGFAQTGFRAEFNYLVPDTPVEGGDYRLRGLYADGDALGFPVDSVTAGKFFYDAKGRLYEIVYSNAAQPLTIEVDTVGHSFAPTLGIGLLTDRTVNIFLPFETSKIAGKLRSIVEVETRKLIDFNSGVEVDKLADLLDVDTTGLGNSYIVRYVADSAKWYVFENNIDGLTDGFKWNNNLYLGTNPAFLDKTGTSYGNIGIGPSALATVNGATHNVGIGVFAGRYSSGGENVAIGYGALGIDGLGGQNIVIGIGAQGRSAWGVPEDTPNYTSTYRSVIIGKAARTKQRNSDHEIVIGASAVGNGIATATIGSSVTNATFLKGALNISGYGQGNREAGDTILVDNSVTFKTQSRYLAAFATDGTLLELDTAGLFGGASGASSFVDLNDIDTTGLQDNYAFRYNSTTGLFEAKANNIDGLDDGYTQGTNNLFVGREPFSGYTGNNNVIITQNGVDSLRSPDGYSVGMVVIGANANDKAKAGSANSVIIGNNALQNSTGSEEVIAIGGGAGQNFSSSASIFIGAKAGINLTGSPETTRSNTLIGHAAAETMTSGIENVGLGYLVDIVNGNNQIVIGSGHIAPGQYIRNTSKGPNSAKLGNERIDSTFLYGNLTFPEYGLGNKEAGDLSKTGSGYFLEVATDGTLIESQVTGDVQLTDLSVLVNSAGSANLEYDNTTGVFTYTPPDLSSYLTSEVDGSTTNEIQTISLASNILSISGAASTVDLSPYLDDTNTNLGNSNLAMGGSGGTRRADFTNNTLEIVNETGSIDLGYLDPNSDGSFIRLNNSSDNTLIYGNRIFSVGEVVFSEYGIGIYQGSDNNYLLAVDSVGYVQEVPIGTFLTTEVDGSITNEIQSLSFNEATRELTLSSDGTIDLTEGIQDEIAATITAGTGITVTYDDGAGTLEIAAPTGSGNTDEQTLSINEATAELTISNGNTVDLSELIDEQVNTLLTAGDNIALTYNDVANTLTISASGDITNIDQIDFNANTADAVEGRLQYDTEFGTLVFGLNNDTPLHIGSDMGWYVKNQTGSDIAAGVPVYASGTDGSSGRITVAPMIADGTINAKYFLGVTAEAIVNGADGFVWTHGKIRGINLSSFSAGDVLYVSSASAGAFVNTSPSAPNLKLPVGFVVDNTANGTLAVRATVGNYISESHDVQIASASNGEVLKFDGSKWVDGTDLVDDADADATNEIQDLSLSGNTLSLSGDATTVDLSGYLDDQTVSLTGAGITAISGTYPNFTITSTEVDGSVTNEIQDLSLSGNTLSLSGDATTVDLSGYLDEATTASNGLTETGNDIKLGGTLTGTTLIDIESNNFYINDDGATQTGIAIIPGSEEVNIVGKITGNTELQMTTYGLGNKEASDLSLTGSAYLASFATDGTLIEYPISSISGESTTASNGLTLSGSDVKLGGTLSETTAIYTDGNTFGVLDATTGTSILVDPTSDLVTMSGEVKMITYGSGNAGADDLGETLSPYKAAFADDGTIVEYDDIDAMVVACSDETTDITTGTAKVTFRAPHAMTITGVRASLTTASSSGTVTVDINEDISGGGASILGTKLTIDANEKTSTTAATAATITDTAIADDAEITIDIDAAGTGATGLKVTILYRKN